MPEEAIALPLNAFLNGSSAEKLEVLKGLLGKAAECRARADARACPWPESEHASEAPRPWEEFSAIIGETLFSAIEEIVRQEPPSELREFAGDIMAHIWHPCAIGRLLEKHERRGDTVLTKPPLDIYRDLSGIGTEAAAKALMWLWGCKWDADIAGALAMCRGENVQNFLMEQARAHPNSHVRATCIAGVTHPITPEKAAFLVERLENGSYNEQYYSLYMISELRVARAAEALAAFRRKTSDRAFTGLIDEALPRLCL